MRFSVRELPLPSSLCLSGPSIGSGHSLPSIITGKPCIYRAIDWKAGSITLLLKEPDYSFFPASFRLLCRLLPPRAALLAVACRQRHIHVPFITRAGCSGCTTWASFIPWLCQGSWIYPTLLFQQEPLSIAKPPHVKKQLRCFLTVLDGIKAPGPGNERNPLGFRPSVPHCSGQFRQQQASTGPIEARFLSNQGGLQPSVPSLQGPVGPYSLRNRLLPASWSR